VSTIDNNTPVPAHELRELKRAYRKTIRSTELVVGSVSSFTGLKLPALTTSQSQDSANIPVDRVVAPDEFDSQFVRFFYFKFPPPDLTNEFLLFSWKQLRLF
jgi:hypothetical protein